MKYLSLRAKHSNDNVSISQQTDDSFLYMIEATVIYPHHLFKEHPALKAGRSVFIVEDYLFFAQYQFHKNKLVYHRASMKAYKDKLEQSGYKVTYIDCQSSVSIGKILSEKNIGKAYLAELDDDWLHKRLQADLKKHEIEVEFINSPLFLTSLDWSANFYDKGKSYSQTEFYKAQRKRMNILLDEDQKPIGGKWTFDTENRKRLPLRISLPPSPIIQDNSFLREALAYVEQNFGQNPGKTNPFVFPVTHELAEEFFDQFLLYKLSTYGDYQDSLTTRDHFLFHSLLSPLINTGLLCPRLVLEKTLQFSENNNVPLNSLEGFIRQILGWREFCRVIYNFESRKQRTQNYWGFSRKIPSSFWSATTGIIPVDSVISKVLDTSYAHHIERLMVVGNFMLLCEFHPDEVYRWFMELFIDSFDWVMVPNVYGMSQYADGGLITTKPYISSSNYIKKMGDYPDGDWNKIWDGLYWHFIWKQKKKLETNYRMTMMIRQLEKMDGRKLETHLEVARRYLNSIES